jgi:glycosyltransferase involved in cell wall biosynthesis
MYKVTLSMPIYNVEKYVERALLSALNQTFESIEYILVDDKGTDSSIDIVKEVIKKHPRGKDVRIIDHESNIGLGGTRNTAIDNAQSEFLYFMDSDDEITPDCISILYKAMMETPVDFVAASHKRVSSDIRRNKMVVYSDTFVQKDKYAVASNYYLRKMSINLYTWNKLYNINYLKNNSIKCIPHHIGEDLYFSFQVILQAESCRLLPDITYIYYDAGWFTSIHWNNFSLRWCQEALEIFTLQIEYAQFFHDIYFYPDIIKSIYKNKLDFAINLSKSNVLSSKEKKYFLKKYFEYPVSIEKIVNTHKNYASSLIYYIFSKIPILKLKLLLCIFINNIYSKKRLY